MFRLVLIAAAALLTGCPIANAGEIREGMHYRMLSPPRQVENRQRIEVVEFFWYKCPHCFRLEGIIQNWAKRLPGDVVFRRVPAVFPGQDGKPGNWAPLARLHLTLEAMNLADKMQSQVFDAIHLDGIKLEDPRMLMTWLAGKGVDRQRFLDVYNSAAVQAGIERAQALTASYGLDDVPALCVDGRYVVAADWRNPADAVAITDVLVDKARKERRKSQRSPE